MLRRHALVERKADLLAIHRLVQVAVRRQLDPSDWQHWAGVAVRLLEAAFPTEGFEDPDVWPACARLLSHAMAAAGHAEQQRAELAATAELLDRVECYLHGRAQYGEARTLAERALKLAEAASGPTDITVTARMLNNLAVILHDQGDLEGARRLHERALAIREDRLGPDHPSTTKAARR